MDNLRMEKRSYTTGEVARFCDASTPTVIKWIKKGELRAYRRPGGIYRIPHNNLVAFMAKYGFPTSELRRPRQKRRILIVDDDEAVVSFIQELLETHGDFEVRSASSGYRAGVEVEIFKPDLVILDILLEDVDGREVCEHLRRQPDTSRTKILGISGKLTKNDGEELKNVGFDDFLSKPFLVKEFMAKVIALLNSIGVGKGQRNRRKVSAGKL